MGNKSGKLTKFSKTSKVSNSSNKKQNNIKNKTPPHQIQKTKETIIEELLIQSYSDLSLEFTQNDLLTFKLKFNDSEKYFFTTFLYLLFFNNALFKDNITTLYDNYIHTITSYCKSPLNQTQSYFTMGLALDDESESPEQTQKVEFETLFYLIFEKLEINLLLFFDLTNLSYYYMNEFFNQLFENSNLFKCNRKFDCIYFLGPDTDYFIKNSTTITYLSNKKDINVLLDEINKYFLQIKYFKKFGATKYEITHSNDYIHFLIEKALPINIISAFYINGNGENLYHETETQMKLMKTLLMTQSKNVIVILYIDGEFQLNEEFNNYMKDLIEIYYDCCKLENVNSNYKNVKIKLCITYKNTDTKINADDINKKISEGFKDKYKHEGNISKNNKYILCFEINQILMNSKNYDLCMVDYVYCFNYNGNEDYFKSIIYKEEQYNKKVIKKNNDTDELKIGWKFMKQRHFIFFKNRILFEKIGHKINLYLNEGLITNNTNINNCFNEEQIITDNGSVIKVHHNYTAQVKTLKQISTSFI